MPKYWAVDSEKICTFDGVWNKKHMTDGKILSVSLSVKGELRCKNFVW